MARKKKPEKPPNHERWLVSYGDFITLLFAVFVTLYAMSQVDKKKLDEVAASYRDAFSVSVSGENAKTLIPKTDVITIPKVTIAPIPYAQYRTSPSAGPREPKGLFAGQEDFQTIINALRKKLAAAGASGVDLHVGARGLVISLPAATFFAPGSGTVTAASAGALSVIADALTPYANPISCEGHTDNTPVSSAAFASNWELSAARAASVARALADDTDFRPERLSVSGYGEYRPIANNNSEEGRKRNNRVDIILLNKDGAVRDAASDDEEAPRQPPPL
ncbi:MAG: OmpA family protein [Desulfobulbaceae bacterium]|jgi:chemotaxis protein MotB|nr:OmpA family protein [Desulfobulbaceae bacterium]